MAKFFWDYLYSIESRERLCPLEYALRIQDAFLDRKIDGDEYNFIFFAEHESIYSCPQDKIDLLQKADRLFRTGKTDPPAKLYPIPEGGHGGSITYHGPGQLTCYIVLCLEDFGIYGGPQISKLFDEIIKNSISKFGVIGYSIAELKLNMVKEAETSQELAAMSAQGVWVLNKAREVKKIASRGLKVVSRPVGGTLKHFTKFGFAINITTDLSYFDYIYPCGLDIQMTSIEDVTQNKPKVLQVARVVADIAIEKFSGLNKDKK